MEAAPRLPMISFDIKKCSKATDFSHTIKKFIHEQYGEDPDGYLNEIQEFEALRASAVYPSVDFNGCSTLKRYFCQLNFLLSRFPNLQLNNSNLTFYWYDIYSSSVYTSQDVQYELASILYNIGALHTKLGALDSRNSADGMKISCTHFQCAYLSEMYPQSRDSDLSPGLLQLKSNLSLAQAQECILEKSMTDNRKPTIIGKISMQVSEYYQRAKKFLDQNKSQDTSVADLVGSKLVKAWKFYFEFKIAYYDAITYLYMGIQAEDQQNMGERLAYFQCASEKLANATKLAKNLEDQSSVAECLTFTNDVIGGKHSAAVKENEFIYHEKVPSVSSFPEIKGASLVKGIPFSINDTEVSGPDIFSRLVPLEAHQAASLYSEEKAKLMRNMGEEIQEKNVELESFLCSLQLESLSLDSPSDSLPQELVDCCADLTVNHGTKALVDTMAEIKKYCDQIDSKLSHVQKVLKEEDEKEKLYVAVMGKQAPKIIINELKRELSRYLEAHESAQSNNNTLNNAMQQHLPNLGLLSQSLDQVNSLLPSLSSVESESDVLHRQEMKRLLSKVQEMQTQRLTLENQLRESLQKDDVTNQIVTATESKEELFRSEIKKHDKFVKYLEQNMAAQSNILQSLSEANAAYAGARRLYIQKYSQRKEKISSLLNSYNAYVNILKKAEDAVDFYKKLEMQINKLSSRVSSVCAVHEEEREERLNISLKNKPKSTGFPSKGDAPATAGPKLKDFLQYGQVKAISENVPHNEENKNSPVMHNYPQSYSSTSLPYMQHLNISNSTIRPTPLGSEHIDSKMSGTFYPSAPSSSPKHNFLANLSPHPQGDAYTSPNGSFQNSGFSKYGNYSAAGSYSSTKSGAQYASNCSVSFDQKCYLGNNVPYQATFPSVPYCNFQSLYSFSSPTYMNSVSSSQSIKDSLTSADTASNAVTTSGYFNYNPLHSSPIISCANGQPHSLVTASKTCAMSVSPHSASLSCNSGNSYYNPNGTVPFATNVNVSWSNGAVVNSQPHSSGTVSHPYSIHPLNFVAPISHTVQPTNYQGPASQNMYSSVPHSHASVNHIPPVSHAGQSINIQSSPSHVIQPSLSNVIQSSHFLASTSQAMQPSLSNTGQSTNFQAPISQAFQPSETNVALPITSQTSMPQDTQPPCSHINQSFNFQGSILQTTQASLTNFVYPYYQIPTTQVIQHANIQPPFFNAQANTFQRPALHCVLPAASQVSVPLTTSTQTSSYICTTKSSISNIDLLAGITLISSDEQALIPSSKGNEKNNADKPQNDLPNLVTSALTSSSEKMTEEKHSIDLDILSKCISKTCRPPTDPLSNDDVIYNLLSEADRMSKFVENLDKKSLNGPTNLELKWKELNETMEKRTKDYMVSVARCYPLKNRFPDILPFDRSRVPLSSPRDDYINAANVKFFFLEDPMPMILTQFPMPSTINDFWALVWEQQVELIICACTDAEVKGSVYWPLSCDTTVEYGRYSVTLHNIKEVHGSSFCQRLLHIHHLSSKSSRVVIHLQFLDWRPGSLPESPGKFLHFVSEICSLQKQQRNKLKPVIIHCNSGIGRSGVTAALAAFVNHLIAKGSILDIWVFVLELCEQQRNALQDSAHLKFLYSASLYYVQDILMKRGFLSNKSTFHDSPRDKTHVRHPSADLLSSYDLSRLKSKLGFEEIQNLDDQNVTSTDENGSDNLVPPVQACTSTVLHLDTVPPSLVSVIDPEKFVVEPPNLQSKITKESFEKPGSNLGKSDPADPLSSLDPLWSLKK